MRSMLGRMGRLGGRSIRPTLAIDYEKKREGDREQNMLGRGGEGRGKRGAGDVEGEEFAYTGPLIVQMGRLPSLERVLLGRRQLHLHQRDVCHIRAAALGGHQHCHLDGLGAVRSAMGREVD